MRRREGRGWQLNRRTFIKLGAGVGAAMAAGCSTAQQSGPASVPPPGTTASAAFGEADPEYIVVGWGAGGGTLAARLAEAEHRVVLLEAGCDPRQLAGARLPDDNDVPCCDAFSTENEAMKWDFFVRHYGDDAQQRRDTKYGEEWNGRPVDGALYPRDAGRLHRAQRDDHGLPPQRGLGRHRRADRRRFVARRQDCGSISSGSRTVAIGRRPASSGSSASTRADAAGAAGSRRKRRFPWWP